MMKSDLIGKEKGEAKPVYPCLMLHKESGRVILFSAPQTGVIVHESLPRPEGFPVWGIGHYATNWWERDFVLLEGEIILKN